MKCLGPHKYKRITLDRNKFPVYKCIRCPHYVLEPYVIGRESECWYCGNTFIMSSKSFYLKPHCGCKSAKNISLEKTSKGVIIANTKDQIPKTKPKTIDPMLSEAKSNVIDSLLAKLGSK